MSELSEAKKEALEKRLGDTWLTCLKFLIPLYALYYLIDRRTVTPWVTGFLFSIAIAIASQATDSRMGIDTSAKDYYDLAPGLSYMLMPLGFGVGAMKAKNFAKKKLATAGGSQDEIS